MELSYENLKNNPKTLLAFTGFDVGEFQILLKAFTIAWEKYVQQHRLPMKFANEVTVVMVVGLWWWTKSSIGDL